MNVKCTTRNDYAWLYGYNYIPEYARPNTEAEKQLQADREARTYKEELLRVCDKLRGGIAFDS